MNLLPIVAPGLRGGLNIAWKWIIYCFFSGMSLLSMNMAACHVRKCSNMPHVLFSNTLRGFSTKPPGFVDLANQLPKSYQPTALKSAQELEKLFSVRGDGTVNLPNLSSEQAVTAEQLLSYVATKRKLRIRSAKVLSNTDFFFIYKES